MENKSSMIAIVSIVGLVVVLLAVLLMNKPVINVNPYSNNNQISVVGLAELTVAPDQARVFLTVLTDGETAKMAQDENSRLSAQVKDALMKSGIKESDIETSNYYLYKKTEWDNDKQKNVDKGYELTHTVKVTTTDMQNVGKLVDTAITAGANGVERVSFDLTKDAEKKIRDEALVKATVAAKDKADSIVSTLGVKLGKLVSIQESNFYYTPYDYSPNYAMVKGEATADSNFISPQKVNVQSSITLMYEIG